MYVSGTFLQYLKQFPDVDRIVRRSDGTVHKSLAAVQTRKRSPDATGDLESFNRNKFRVIECEGDDSTDEGEEEELAAPVKLSTGRTPSIIANVVELD
jgi:hypothetical protein